MVKIYHSMTFTNLVVCKVGADPAPWVALLHPAQPLAARGPGWQCPRSLCTPTRLHSSSVTPPGQSHGSHSPLGGSLAFPGPSSIITRWVGRTGEPWG